MYRSKHIRALVKNASYLLSGNGLAVLLSIGATTIAARSIGAEGLGIITLISGVTFLLSGFANLNGWQALIKFGSDAIESDNRRQIIDYMRLTFLMEFGVLVCVGLVAISLASYITDLIGLSSQYRKYLIIFTLILPIYAQGAFIGILRLQRNFAVLAWRKPIASGILFLGYGFMSLTNNSLTGFLIITLLSEVVMVSFTIISAIRVMGGLSKDGWISRDFSSIKDEIRPFIRFTWTASLNTSFSQIPKRADVILVGALAGESSAGVYRIAKIAAQAPNLINNPLMQVIYPQITALFSAGKQKEALKFSLQSGFLIGMGTVFYCLVFIALGRWMIETIYGEAFIGAYSAGIFLLFAWIIAGFGLPLQPVALSLNIPQGLAAALFSALPIYLIVAFSNIPRIGIDGASFAYLAFMLVWFIVVCGTIAWTLRRAHEV